MRYLFSIACCLIALSACEKQELNSKKEKSVASYQSLDVKDRPYVILISADGFRPDYITKFGAANLKKFQGEGVSSEYMLPSFPSSTFPNHVTLATGLHASHHGIVDQRFYSRTFNEPFDQKLSKGKNGKDAKWFEGGVPLWVLANQNKVGAYCSYWFGSDAPAHGVDPARFGFYDKDKDEAPTTLDERIAAVVEQLNKPEAERPHLVAFYIADVDWAGHKNGPNSDKTKLAVEKVDKAIKSLADKIDQLKDIKGKVNYVFVSDHGMVEADTKNTIAYPTVDNTKFHMSVDETMIQLYAKNAKDIKDCYDALVNAKGAAVNYDIYLRNDVPAHLKYSTADDKHNRIGDILLMAKSPFQFFKEETKKDGSKTKPKAGTHGYDPSEVKDTHAIFFAWGPAFNKATISRFNNVDVYPLVAHLLGIQYTNQIDGVASTLVNTTVLK